MQTKRTSGEDRASRLAPPPRPGAPWRVTSVETLPGHRLQVRFVDGVEGAVVFRSSFFRGAFAPLADERRFREARIVNGVVTWPGDLDIAPDAMHDEIAAHGRWELE